MRRFMVDNGGNVGETVLLPESEARHISRVLRLPPGTAVELLDGSGLILTAVLVETGRQVRAKITGLQAPPSTRSVSLLVAQGLLKGQKMDEVIQRCTELGVSRLLPFWSSRCQGKLDEQRGGKKLERYQRIVESASKQCCRTDLMTIDLPRGFGELLADFPAAEGRLRLLFWEEERQHSLHDLVLPPSIQEVVILLGPEGGLSAEEAGAARSQGWLTVTLGRLILRAETATLTATSLVQFLIKNI